MNEKILLVEDDPAIGEMVKDHLEKEGFQIRHATNGTSGINLFHQEHFELILLDLMLPEMNGLDILQAIRQKSTIPIIILSAKESDVDKVLGLGFGADDYLTKPFSLIELSARIKSSLRRVNQYIQNIQHDESQQIQIHELTLDTETLRVYKNGREIPLTSKELHILKLLMTHPKRAFTKAQIYQAVWQQEYYGDENAIQVHISRLREKIEDIPSSPQYIKTVWGIGYRLGDF
ncbi:response regulator transcription factor [Seinonella peptonophila]|nr:response regulator transcription factor [Seinonella peptonophila]